MLVLGCHAAIRGEKTSVVSINSTHMSNSNLSFGLNPRCATSDCNVDLTTMSLNGMENYKF